MTRIRVSCMAEIRDRLSEYLARAKKRNEPIVVTHHGKPYGLILPLEEGDLEDLEWQPAQHSALAGRQPPHWDTFLIVTYKLLSAW